MNGMTNQEKQQIIKLKKEGMSYSTIASITGFNESTIKTILKSLAFTILHTLFFIFVYRFIVFKVTLWFI